MMKSLYKRLQKQITLLESLFETNNIDLATSECNALDRIYTELSDVHARLGIIMEDDDEKSDENEEYTSLSITMDEADSK